MNGRVLEMPQDVVKDTNKLMVQFAETTCKALCSPALRAFCLAG